MNSAILKYAVNVLSNKSLQYVSDMIEKFDKIQFLQPLKGVSKTLGPLAGTAITFEP